MNNKTSREVLEVKDIHTYYDYSYVLQGMSLRLERSTVVTIVGRNGAGKTTLVRSIIAFTPPRRGQVFFNGTDITGLAPHIIAKMGVALVPQGRRVFQSLSVKENLSVVARSRGKGWSMDRIYSLFPVLKAREHQKAGKLSGGEQSMLSLARGLRCEPDLLLMDEPSEGLAPLLVRGLSQVIQQLKEEHLSILLVEQNFNLATEVADNVYVMNKGKLVYESAPEDLLHQEEVKTRYLGI